jgi:DNA polymerase III subunit alpha
MREMTFSHLHVHSHYSLLNALPQIKDLVKTAKEHGSPAMALTDNGSLYGAIEFYKTCKAEEIKPIIGVDAYLAPRTRHNKQAGVDNRWSRLVLLAKNEVGYKNLLRLSTRGHTEGFYYKPRIDRELIEELRGEMICICPSFSGEIVNALKFGDEEKALEALTWYKEQFGDDFYIEITHHPEIGEHEKYMKDLIAFAKKYDAKIVAAHDAYYLKADDASARDTLMSIQSHSEKFRGAFDEEEDFSLLHPDEIEKHFSETPEALDNVHEIVEKCNIELELGKWCFPLYEIEGGVTADDELRRLSYEGVEKRGLTLTPEMTTRIDYELDIIKTKGYSAYFLIVSDLLKHARDSKIICTTRGSAAGSMVSYLNYITTVDPMEYLLPFERFLNPERPSAPDIDMDIADNKRDEMIQYSKDKYGEDKVAQIGTFGTMLAKGSVRDTARALGFPYSKGDEIAKLIPLGSQGFAMSIDRAIDEVDDLKKLYDKDAEAKAIIDMAKKIEGCARHISVHAAGVVISPTTLTDFVPLQLDPKGGGKLITQFDMHAVEDAGLIKFDFLGIKNLAILADAVKRVKKMRNIDIDLENIPIDDPTTFAMLARGETIGLFQLNGSGMTRYLKELKPSTIHDINAMVALYRPGPMESIPQYIERKHNPHLVTYLDPRMEEIVNRSFGIITYQDDVMMIAIKLAGYSWLEADKLRKAMGKKIPAVMEAQKSKLMEGLAENGMSATKAQTLWKLIEPFAAYGFNKAHAASYGRVAYQTSYMKANFPVIYMSAVLTADSGDTEKIAEIIAECDKIKIPVLPPDINESYSEFTALEDSDGENKIRFGLTTIKNFGEAIGEAIVEERKQNGAFTSFEDFLSRVNDRNLNKKSLESLAKVGAFDTLIERNKILENLEYILQHKKETAHAPQGQDSLFGLMSDTSTVPSLSLKEAKEATLPEKLSWEKELLGLYLSGHPLEEFKEKLKKIPHTIMDIKEKGHQGVTLLVPAVIEEAKKFVTKGGKNMYFVKITDMSGTLEGVIFPKTAKEYEEMLEETDPCVLIKGKFSRRNGEPSIIIEKMKRLVN